jgi:hypothetical protein
VAERVLGLGKDYLLILCGLHANLPFTRTIASAQVNRDLGFDPARLIRNMFLNTHPIDSMVFVVVGNIRFG